MPYNPPNALNQNTVGFLISQIPSLLIAATNLALNASDFSQASWVKTGGATVTTNSDVAPNGATEADTLTDVGAGNGFIQQTVAIPDDSNYWTGSFYVKAGTSVLTQFELELLGGATPVFALLTMNLQNGQILNSVAFPSTTASVLTLLINGVTWYRVSLTAKNNSTGNTSAMLAVLIAATNTAAAGTIIAWNAQIESGQFATGYIPTGATAVTRVAGKLPSWILDVTGTPTMSNYTQQYFLATANYTVPAGVTTIYASGIGGGGGGGGTKDNDIFTACGGGSGATAQRVPITVTPAQVIAVTIPAAAAGGIGSATIPTAGADGGNVTLGALLTLNGGKGGGQGDSSVAFRAALGGAKTVSGTFDGMPGIIGTTEFTAASSNGGGYGGGLGGLADVAGGPNNKGLAAKANSGGGGGGASISNAQAGSGGAGGTGYMLIETF